MLFLNLYAIESRGINKLVGYSSGNKAKGKRQCNSTEGEAKLSIAYALRKKKKMLNYFKQNFIL